MKAEGGPRGINEGGTRTRAFRSNTSRSCVSCLHTGDITVPSYDVMSEDQGHFFIYIYIFCKRKENLLLFSQGKTTNILQSIQRIKFNLKFWLHGTHERAE